jgi:hypothetical protein
MPLPQPSKSENKVPFIKWEEGQNRIRIVSEPQKRWTQYLESDKKSIECQGRDCAYCAAGLKVNHDYFFMAISRSEQLANKNPDGTPGDPSVKMCRFAPGLYGEYFELSQNPDWSFDSVPNFDVVVSRTGQKLLTKYTLTPCPAKDLSDRDKEAIKNSKTINDMMNELFPRDTQASGQVPTESIPF